MFSLSPSNFVYNNSSEATTILTEGVGVDYLVTIDLVPESLFEQVFSNKALLEEWEEYYSIDVNKLKGDFEKNGISSILNLSECQGLVIDTQYFDEQFKNDLLSKFDNIDQLTGGELINSDNFQGLRFLDNKYSNNVASIYIDPPYNGTASEILYKNSYKHSSWLSLMSSRYEIARGLLKRGGIICTAIDDVEFHRLEALKTILFGEANHIANIAIMHNPKGRDQTYIASAHEYTVLFSNDIELAKTNRLALTEKEIEDKYPKKDDQGRYRELPLRRRGSAPSREDRQYMYFPFLVDQTNSRISLIPIEEYEYIYDGKNFDDQHVENLKIKYLSRDIDFILPIRDDGSLGRWRWGYEKCVKSCDTDVFLLRGTPPTIYAKDYADPTYLPKSLWFDNKYDASTKGTNVLKSIIPNNDFDYPKSIFAVCDFLSMTSDSGEVVLDYFAGSATTAHAAIELKRKYQEDRKFLLIEMGKHFDSVVKPRIKKVLYSSTWKKGKPRVNDGISQFIKCIRLESYEDVLNNLELSLSNQNSDLLKHDSSLREDYMLGYWLEVETEGSPSILSIEQFETPFDYKLNVGAGSVGVSKPTKVDLVETFNYLVGLSVKTIGTIRGFKVVTGVNLKGESVLIIWRNVKEKDNDALEEFLCEQRYNPRDTEFDHIYVNGDHTFRRPAF